MSAPRFHTLLAGLLLALMFVLAGGAALRESPTFDETAHIGAGLSYLQKFDLRLNPEHPPLGKVIAALPLALQGVSADYTCPAWKIATSFFPAYSAQWIFGDGVLGRWNPWKSTLAWARLPMLLLTLLLGWIIYLFGTRLGGSWSGLLCLAVYVSTPAFLVFGPLVITDIPVTLFSVIVLWQLAEVWVLPSKRNEWLFGLALAAALLAKFTGLILFAVFAAWFIQTRFWPTSIEPNARAARKAWRRSRWQAVLRGLLWAGILIYVFYFVFSWNQPNDALDRVGSGFWAAPVRRILMPPWLYIRGLALMLYTGSRPTFLLGHFYPHGEPFYFPVVFGLKSPLSFLLLLVMTAVVAFIRKGRRLQSSVSPDARVHWRVLTIGLIVFTIICLLSRLDISIRHFSIPLVLLILMLAPLPRMLAGLPAQKLLQTAAAGLALACVGTAIAAYPFFFPFVNSLGMGHPAYTLMNDSNVDWNEGLPEVERFVQQHNLSRVKLDWLSLSDPAIIVPAAVPWNCQEPGNDDAGRWVVVSAVEIREGHNCGWLEKYPRESLAGGGMYAFHLPGQIPAEGQPGGPPLAADRKSIFGVDFDLRGLLLDVERHPEKLPSAMEEVARRYQSKAKSSDAGSTKR